MKNEPERQRKSREQVVGGGERQRADKVLGWQSKGAADTREWERWSAERCGGYERVIAVVGGLEIVRRRRGDREIEDEGLKFEK
jgi:hypothetical protein